MVGEGDLAAPAGPPSVGNVAPPAQDAPAPVQDRPPAPGLTFPESDPTATLAGRQVVLADAARPFRSVVRPLLDDLGCRVEMAAEGIEAFRLAVARRPELLIASVHLAGLSGVAICEGVKGSPHLKGIKVALVGSDLSADLFNRETAMAYGADVFLDEGMSAEALRLEIARLLGERRLAATHPAVAAIPPPRPDTAEPKVGPDEEIGVLARLMLSDLRLYYPDRYEQAVREGTLFDVFSDELTKGRAMLDERYPEVPDRHKILAAALRDGLESGSASGEAASSSGTRTG
jgi:CheY-like chemotaxis protein